MTNRPEGTIDPKIATGEIKGRCDEVKVLNTSQTPVFPIEDDVDVAEEVRLEYRFLDLRRQYLKNNIITRHKTAQSIRSYMKARFLEIETPILIKNTPEGAREYVVPSRVYPGKFYVLPQSPQLFKQLSMIAGFESITKSPGVSGTRTPRRPPARVYPGRYRNVLHRRGRHLLRGRRSDEGGFQGSDGRGPENAL